MLLYMKKTMKMSSFFLTIGLGCMLIYVLLNIFNLPIVEGMEKAGPDPKAKQKQTEKVELLFDQLTKELEKTETQYETENGKNWRAIMEWEKLGPLHIRWAQMRRNRLLNLMKWNQKEYNGPESLNKKGKAIIDNIRDLDYTIQVYQEDPRDARPKAAPAAGKTGIGL